MMAYSGDVCSGYMASYDGDAWCWTGQGWAGYYDVGAWDYQQQQQAQGWPAGPEPQAGAELLTELRLAELKRLIDRDADALKKSEAREESHFTSDGAKKASLNAAKKAGLNADAADFRDTGQSSASAGGEGVAPKSGEDFVLPGSDKLEETALKPPLQPYDDASESASTQDRPASSEQEPKVPSAPSKPKAPSSGSEADVVARVEAVMPQATPAASPRCPEDGQEQRYVAMASFEPETRQYGELPVREGDEIFVTSDPVDGWIFGQRRGADADEGWLPASALGLGAAEEADDRAAAEEQERQSQRQRRTRGRGASEGGRGSGGGRTTGAVQYQRNPPQQPQPQAGAAPKQQAHQQSRKADYGWGDSEQLQASGGNDRTGEGSLDQQPWHHHGNWWSRQRHLKPQERAQESKEAETRRQQWEPAQQTSKGHTGSRTNGGAHGQAGRKAKQAAEDPDEDEEEEDEDATGVAAKGRGRGRGGGRGGGGRSRPEERAQRRARPALSSLLDRLNKPLVAPTTPAGK